MGYVQVFIECPGCGKLLMKRNSLAESKSTCRGTTRCPVCKKTVEFAITGSHCHTNFK